MNRTSLTRGTGAEAPSLPPVLVVTLDRLRSYPSSLNTQLIFADEFCLSCAQRRREWEERQFTRGRAKAAPRRR